jgi:hypothetical protein
MIIAHRNSTTRSHHAPQWKKAAVKLESQNKLFSLGRGEVAAALREP